MADETHRFTISITTPGKVYAPGEPVPIGTGKDKVPKKEIAAIEARHGVFDETAGKAPAASDDKALAAMTAERDAALKSMVDASEGWALLKASLEADEGTDDANALDDRMTALDALLTPPASS